MNINYFKVLALLLAALFGLAGCIESEDGFLGNPGPTDPGASYTINATSTTPVVVVGGTVDITATLLQDGDLPVAGAPITFWIDNGSFSGSVTTQLNTNANGVARATLTAPLLVGTGKVTVMYSDKSAGLTLTYIAGPPTRISLDASPAEVGVSSESTLTSYLQDKNGNPIANKVMQFEITTAASGTPKIAGTGIVQTDSSGLSTVTYTSGTIDGTSDIVTVSPIDTGTPFTTAKIDVTANSTTISSLEFQTYYPSSAMKVGTTQDLTAKVLDSDGTAVGGLNVVFTIDGAGSIGGEKWATAKTDDVTGVATVTLQAPILVNSASITVSAAGLSKSLSLTYVPDVPATVELSASPAVVGVSSDSNLAALVYDKYGNVTPNELVVFTVGTATDSTGAPLSPSGGVLSPSTGNALTGSNGVAAILYTSGASVGTDAVTAEVTSSLNGSILASAKVNIDVTAAASEISSLALARELPSTSMLVGTIQTLSATVLDNNKDPVAGLDVAFVIEGQGGFSYTDPNGNSVTGAKLATATTGTNGVAEMNLDAPILVGSATVTASAAGLSQSVSLTYVPDVPYTVDVEASPVTVGVSSNSTVTAIVYDQYGNLTPGEQVLFTVGTATDSSGNVLDASGGVLTPSAGYAVTNTSGMATIEYTSGAQEGTDRVTVTAENGGSAVPPTDYVDIVVASAASSIGSLALSTQFPGTTMVVGDQQDLLATVLDTEQNPVAGQQVKIYIEGQGRIANSTYATAVTNASGIATVALDASITVGSGTITASAGSLTSSVSLTYVPDLPYEAFLTADPVEVGASSPSQLSATIYDKYGNLTPSELVKFSFSTDTSGVSLNNSGGYLTPSTGYATTDGNGVATIWYTAGSTSGVVDTLKVAPESYDSSNPQPSAKTDISVISGAVPMPAKLIVGTDTTTIPSDSSEVATITAILLDSANVVVPNANVNFSSSGGVLSAGSVVTDADGRAIVTLSAGSDRTNQTITVTASSIGVPGAFVPVAVTGSTVAITPTRSNLILGGTDTATLTIKAADSGGTGVYNATVTAAIDGAASTGTANLSVVPTSGSTDTLGEWHVDLTGTSAGTVRVVASALGASTYYDFTVETVAGSLTISSPVSGSTAPINTATAITVDVPTGTTDVRLVSSLGVFNNATPAAGGIGTNILTWTGLAPPTTVTATLTSSSIGTSTIDVADSNDLAKNDSIKLVFVDQIVDANSTVALQASPTTVAVSSDSVQNDSSLVAIVKNANNEPIANAMVTFSMSNTTGSGEYIEPSVAYSDASGVARSTFYSGTQSTDSTGLVVKAELWQTADPTLLADSSTAQIIVGGTAGAIAIGTSTKIASTDNNTTYTLPVSIQVTDSGGNPVPNTTVNLSVWPQKYALGSWVCKPEPGIIIDAILPNEDLDKDLVLDALPSEDISGNGALTPPISSAGQIPSEVKTDERGIATFDYVYLKDYGGFIYSAITATALVQGTETRATHRFWLEVLLSEIPTCVLGPSPLNAHWPGITVNGNHNKVENVALGGGVSLVAKLTAPDETSTPMGSESLTATFLLQGSDDGVTAPTLDLANPSLSQATNASGEATFAYQSGGKSGVDVIKISYSPSPGIIIADYVTVYVGN